MKTRSNVIPGKWESLPDIFGVRDMALFLDIGISKAYELIHQDSLDTFRVGKAIRITKISLLNWINKQIGSKVTIDFVSNQKE